MPSRTVNEFLEKFGESSFTNAELLLSALQSEDEASGSYVPEQPCEEYAHIYRVRARMQGREGGPDSERLEREFDTLANTLDETPQAPCRLWMFRDTTRRFFVFENPDSASIFGCVWWQLDGNA